MLLGGFVAALFGFVVGMPALRLKGDYLAIATLAFGEIVRNIFKNLPLFGGAMGLSTQLYDSNSLFIVAIVTLLLVLFLSQNFIRSKHGRAVTAIRDNEIDCFCDCRVFCRRCRRDLRPDLRHGAAGDVFL